MILVTYCIVRFPLNLEQMNQPVSDTPEGQPCLVIKVSHLTITALFYEQQANINIESCNAIIHGNFKYHYFVNTTVL